MTDRTDSLDLLARYHAAFDAGDREAMLACLTDDATHDTGPASACRRCS